MHDDSKRTVATAKLQDDAARADELARDVVLDLSEIDPARLALVGGKGAHLAALSRIDGIRVPPAFCVTTAAFDRVLDDAPSLDALLNRLSRLKPEERAALSALAAEIRGVIEGLAMPASIAAAITGQVARFGEQTTFAVRSSATAEDLPTASFAGQQDSYLNVVGADAVLRHVIRCWASLFTERAVAYRAHNGFDHRRVRMAVVVQQMVLPQAAGILFTADPISGNRKVASVEASFGLGEALVSGIVNADSFKVRDGRIVARQLGSKQRAVVAAAEGGTREEAIAPERQSQPALTDEQVVALVELGRRIEAHLGAPQDVEWCFADGAFHVVQSRPITTLFPLPPNPDGENRVYVSVGHQQMMTDPMKPLGLSVWMTTTRAPMVIAGGRLFVDVTRSLATPSLRAGLVAGLGKSDPLIGDALQAVLERGDFIRPLPEDAAAAAPTAAVMAGGTNELLEADPALVTELVERTQRSLAALKRDIENRSGAALLDFILEDIQGELRRLLADPQSFQALMAGIQATLWLNEKLHEWLGEKSAADTLTLSAPNNVTSEMGMALMEVADAIRPHPEVLAFLQQVDDDGFLDELPRLPGGSEARDAILSWFDRYGMRGVGEIDITRPRWVERPSALVPLILGNVRNLAPGEGRRRFEQGLQEATRKAQELLERLRALPDGEKKVRETKAMIDRVRTFIGYREFPKYGMVSRYFIYKQALMKEAARLVAAGVLREQEDLFFLTLEEMREVARSNRVDEALLRERREAFRSYQALTPPRVLTSEGEGIAGRYRRGDLPKGALVGLAVSSGTVEGRARVVLDLAKANLEPGDILVTAFTDPSWTPLFVGIKGLVTEVGGLMTHGAVIAREYGLPAVVGVEEATRRIRDGQRIRVHGTEGYVELLSQ